MEYSAALIARIVTAAVLAILFGNGSVVAFNRIKPRWFEDYDEDQSGTEPGEPRKVLPPKLLEADNAGRQRLPSSPWKYAFTGYFAITGLYLAIRGGSLMYEISVLCVLFIVVFVIGHAINFGINVIGAYVHTNRLQYVEFFSRFYEGGGKAFNPLKVNSQTFTIKEETNND